MCKFTLYTLDIQVYIYSKWLNNTEQFWTVLNNTEQFWTILNNTEQYWAILNNTQQYSTILKPKNISQVVASAVLLNPLTSFHFIDPLYTLDIVYKYIFTLHNSEQWAVLLIPLTPIHFIDRRQCWVCALQRFSVKRQKSLKANQKTIFLKRAIKLSIMRTIIFFFH